MDMAGITSWSIILVFQVSKHANSWKPNHVLGISWPQNFYTAVKIQ